MLRHFGTAEVPLSQAVRAGDFVFVSGQVALDLDGRLATGTIDEQAELTLQNVKASLALAGATMEQVVKVFVVLEDARDFQAFNRIYAKHFARNPPARTTIEGRLMEDTKIEIEAVAYSPAGSVR